jgi:hypothetical protein
MPVIADFLIYFFLGHLCQWGIGSEAVDFIEQYFGFHVFIEKRHRPLERRAQVTCNIVIVARILEVFHRLPGILHLFLNYRNSLGTDASQCRDEAGRPVSFRQLFGEMGRVELRILLRRAVLSDQVIAPTRAGAGATMARAARAASGQTGRDRRHYAGPITPALTRAQRHGAQVTRRHGAHMR